MKRILQELRKNPVFWLLPLAPVALVAEHYAREAHTLLFFLSISAIVPLATLLGRSTEAVAARTGDTIGGLLNASLGNLPELIIGLAALRAGMFDLVKASMAGAIVAATLFMFGTALLLGGLRHHVQEYNRAGAMLQVSMLLLATVTLFVPSALSGVEELQASRYMEHLSIGLSVLLITSYALGLVFSLGTHREVFAARGGGSAHEEKPWSVRAAVVALAVATVLIALVSEVFVDSVQKAAEQLGMSPAFVGFVVVALAGAAPGLMTAASAARKNRLDMAVGISMGSAAQNALFVAPVLALASYALAPSPMTLTFTLGQVFVVFISMITASIVASTGRSAWYTGVQLIAIYLVFAITLYLLPA
jgi:Ca2+:H+ antiporter